jgi:membrane protein implicated in regulation of membrane protease activity
MNWWGWCILGLVLFGIELFAVDAQFYLIFAGIAALLVGVLGLTGIDLPTWAQWATFGILAIVTMFTVRKQIYLKLMSKPMGNVSTDVDREILLKQDLPPGKACRIEYRGSGWTAVNVGEQAIAAGSHARIDSIDGLTLKLRAL